MARTRAVSEHLSTRCHEIHVCWIAGATLLGAPRGWEFEHIGIGRYNVYPSQFTIADTLKTFAVAAASIHPAVAGERTQPDARTVVVNVTPGCYEIHVYQSAGTYADMDIGLFVLEP